MAVNINSNIKDAFYRYKMPRLQCTVIGKGNGIKTVLPNMDEIGKSLERPPSYPTKFFGCELGAQTTLDDKNSKYIVNGMHDLAKLTELLDMFIKKFVLCASCGNPETKLKIDKSNFIKLDCKACGHISHVDMTHKLCTYIIKNPPASAKSGQGKQKLTKQERRAEKNRRNQKKMSQDHEDEDEEESETAATQSEEPTTNGKATNGTEATLAGGTAAAVMEDLDEIADPWETLAKYLESKKEITAEEVVKKATELYLEEEHEKIAAVVVQIFFNEQIVNQLKEPSKHKLLVDLIKTADHQKGLLGGVERLVGISFPDLMSKTPVILKYLYDEDILEEGVVLQWADQSPSKKYSNKQVCQLFREKASPFVNWLKEADEESDEEDD